RRAYLSRTPQSRLSGPRRRPRRGAGQGGFGDAADVTAQEAATGASRRWGMIEFMAADPGPRVPDSIDEFRTLARARLNTFDRIAVPDDLATRRAAVALCVVDNGTGPAVIVIKRAYRGRNAGQWGLPGG